MSLILLSASPRETSATNGAQLASGTVDAGVLDEQSPSATLMSSPAPNGTPALMKGREYDTPTIRPPAVGAASRTRRPWVTSAHDGFPLHVLFATRPTHSVYPLVRHPYQRSDIEMGLWFSGIMFP
ncbi:hypothetical protein BDW71DRAFT_150953 [Aspergillus fruticulosus]